jgi:UDP-glucuronate decarboxylase
MKILVTGGTGFIGNHLCRRLLNEGNYVICLDNNFTGTIDNIKDLLANPNFKFIEFDIIKPFYYDVDQIYHLACPASPIAYQKDPIKTIKTCVDGTLNAISVANTCKARILFSSTSEVYGDPKISPQIEEYWGNVNPIGIRSCYDEGKRIAETILMEYHRKFGLEVRIARIFNTYGPKMNKNDGRVVSNFINQCIKNQDITIYGDGSQTRSFCYVDDTIDGLIKLMNNNETCGPVNIGNPHEITIKNLTEILLQMTNTTSKIVYNELPSDDPTKRKPDITKAIKFLNWVPKVDLNEGLKKTIEYFKSLD